MVSNYNIITLSKMICYIINHCNVENWHDQCTYNCNYFINNNVIITNNFMKEICCLEWPTVDHYIRYISYIYSIISIFYKNEYKLLKQNIKLYSDKCYTNNCKPSNIYNILTSYKTDLC